MSDKLHAKIAALRAKTIGNGCTEAEALAAATLAARLMAEHAIEDSDLDMHEIRSAQAYVRAPWRVRLMLTVAACTNCAFILEGQRQTRQGLIFIGRNPGIEIAGYLRDLCLRAADGALLDWRMSDRHCFPPGAEREQAIGDFLAAFALRLASRLIAVFGHMDDPEEKRLVRAHIGARFPNARPAKFRAILLGDSAAARAASQAADRVALNPGITTPAPKSLTKRSSAP